MRRTPEASAWHRGRLDRRAGPPELLFGQMYEDFGLELEHFAPGGRVFSIASAGCTAFGLAARGHDVTAVDVNPAQMAYVRERIGGAPVRRGRVDRGFDRVRRLAPALGWRRDVLERFCRLDDPDEQLELWRSRLDTRRLRIALAAAFSPLRLRRSYADPFLSVLPPRFDRVIRLRLERGFARHPNSANPYARSLLLGDPRETSPAHVQLETADAAEFLERCDEGSFDSFSLSNILDGAGEQYAERLWAAVRRAAKPGAVAILRSFGEPADEREAELAGADRSLIWGSIRIERM
jgi:S-adenosylmethionine:diacylglycerol 3-amino-3-carboxypropyl transferase